MSNFVIWFGKGNEIRHVLKAAEVGVEYWAWSKHPISAAYDEDIDIFERHDGTHVGTLNYDKLDKAAGKVIDAAKKGAVADKVIAELVRGGEHISPQTADVLVQFAMFGEQKYE